MTATMHTEPSTGSSDEDAGQRPGRVCARHNQTRELPGWTVETLHSGREGQPHLVATTTPTGHSFLSRGPDPPGQSRAADGGGP